MKSLERLQWERHDLISIFQRSFWLQCGEWAAGRQQWAWRDRWGDVYLSREETTMIPWTVVLERSGWTSTHWEDRKSGKGGEEQSGGSQVVAWTVEWMGKKIWERNKERHTDPTPFKTCVLYTSILVWGDTVNVFLNFQLCIANIQNRIQYILGVFWSCILSSC